MTDGDRADLLIGQLRELFAEWDSVWDDYAEPELRDYFIADFEAVRREARAEENEACAQWHEEQAYIAERNAHDERDPKLARRYYQQIGEHNGYAAAIRARREG